MATNHVWRIILVVPEAQVASVVAWFVANIGAGSLAAADMPQLSASGAAPSTHRWCCGAYTDAEARAILVRLCNLAGVAPPSAATWNGWTRAEKIAWLQSVQAAILAGFGAWVTLAQNDGAWDSPAAQLAARGLQRVPGSGAPV